MALSILPRIASLSALLVALSSIGCRGKHPVPDGVVEEVTGSRWVTPPNRRSESHGVIVFVHGVTGDATGTWTNKTTNAYWPQMLVDDPEFSSFDVYVYEYPTYKRSAAFSIEEIADNVRLMLETDKITSRKKIVFLSHSLGGLVTRQFLLSYRDVAKRVLFLHFFSTPTTGSDYSDLAAMVSKNPQFGQMVNLSSGDFLSVQLHSWLAAEFNIPAYAAYETQDTFKMRIVTQASATNLVTKRLDPINLNHIDIVKPRNNRDVPYLVFKRAFLAESAQGTYSAGGDATRQVDFSLVADGKPIDRPFVIIVSLESDQRVIDAGTAGKAALRLPRQLKDAAVAITQCPGFIMRDPWQRMAIDSDEVNIEMAEDEVPPPISRESLPSVQEYLPSQSQIDAVPANKPDDVRFSYANNADADMRLLAYPCYSHFHEQTGRTNWISVDFPKGKEDDIAKIDSPSGWFLFFVLSPREGRPKYIGTFDLFKFRHPRLIVTLSSSAAKRYEASVTEAPDD